MLLQVKRSFIWAWLLGGLFIILMGMGLLAERAVVGESGAVVRFVNSSGVGLNGTARILCYAADTPGTPPIADLERTLSDGYPTEPVPQSCPFVAALFEVTEQGSSKIGHGPAYWVYRTSFAPGETRPLPAAGTVVISDTSKLTLFNIVASLGWEPAPGSEVLVRADLLDTLRGSSAYLYDLTEGQMAFGPVKIYDDGQKWLDADLRFLPANDWRPAAFVGGIVKESRSYSGAADSTNFTPAGVYLGRAWDGSRGVSDPDLGRWTTVPTGTRTLVHEWSHYGLFLYDEYQQTSGSSDYCVCNNLPGVGCGLGDLDGSVMGYQYTAGEFWHINTHIGVYDQNICENSWNWFFHGNFDWKVIAEWGAIQGTGINAFDFPTTLSKQPVTGLAGDFFGRSAGADIYLPLMSGGSGGGATPAAEPEIEIDSDALPLAAGTVSSEVYLLEGGSSSPERILYLGRGRPEDGITRSGYLGNIRMLGVQPADRARIFVERFGEGARYSFPPTAADDTALVNGRQVDTDLQDWDYKLDHRFEVAGSRVTTLTVSLEAVLTEKPVAQLCSLDAAVGCASAWKQEMTFDGGLWQARFTPDGIGRDELPRHLVIRILADEIGLKGEAIQWLQVSGGVGPGHVDGVAPLADGMIMLNTDRPLDGPGDCNIASFAPARDYVALESPLPPNIGLLGQPYLVRISLPEKSCPTLLPGKDATLPVPVIINVGYEQAQVDAVGANEATLQLLRFVPGSGWLLWQTIDVNQELNFVVGSLGNDGIYAVGYSVP